MYHTPVQCLLDGQKRNVFMIVGVVACMNVRVWNVFLFLHNENRVSPFYATVNATVQVSRQ